MLAGLQASLFLSWPTRASTLAQLAEHATDNEPQKAVDKLPGSATTLWRDRVSALANQLAGFGWFLSKSGEMGKLFLGKNTLLLKSRTLTVN